jgi:hypothetical protein
MDHIRSETGLSPIGLADTWVPAATAAVILIFAAVAVKGFHERREFCIVGKSAARTAFLFGLEFIVGPIC